MRKVLVALTVLAVLAVSAAAYAHMWGGGYGMMGYGPGYGMMGYGPGYDNKAYDETADLRREINSKRFDYMEAVRTGDTEKAAALDKELDELATKLTEKVGDTPYTGGYGRGYGRGGYCLGPYGWQ